MRLSIQKQVKWFIDFHTDYMFKYILDILDEGKHSIEFISFVSFHFFLMWLLENFKFLIWLMVAAYILFLLDSAAGV